MGADPTSLAHAAGIPQIAVWVAVRDTFRAYSPGGTCGVHEHARPTRNDFAVMGIEERIERPSETCSVVHGLQCDVLWAVGAAMAQPLGKGVLAHSSPHPDRLDRSSVPAARVSG